MNKSGARAFCFDLLTKKLSRKVIRKKVKALEKFAKSSFPKSGCFSIEWLAEVIRKIDHLWYGGRMLKQLDLVYGGVHLHHDAKEEIQVAAYVQEPDDGSRISLHVNRDLFASLFGKKERGYHSGGLLCRNKLLCLLHVLLHETVHLVLTACDRLGVRPDEEEHGDEFNQIVRNLFGQTDPQHGLIPGYDQTHDLDTIRSRAKPGARVEVFWEAERWLPAKVIKCGKTWATVEVCLDKRRRVESKLHVGLIRLT